MGPQLDAGQFLRPLDAPRPADRSDFAGTASTNRPEPGDDRFQTILNDARTTKAPRPTESSRRGDAPRAPKPVNHDDADPVAPDAAPVQEPVHPPLVDETSSDTDSADAPLDEAVGATPVASVEGKPQPVPTTADPASVIVTAPVVGQIVTEAVPAPKGDKVSEGASIPAPKEVTAAATSTKTPRPLPESVPATVVHPVSEPVVSLAEVQHEDGEPAPVSTGATSVRERSTDSPTANSTPVGLDVPAIGEFEKASVQVEPPLPAAQRPVARPVEKLENANQVKKARPVPGAKGSARVDVGSLKPADPMLTETRQKEVNQADSDGPLVEVHGSVRHRQISVRTGTGDSAAATVGRFLIETTGEGEPTTANLPPQASERAVSVTTTHSTPTRASAERPGKIDVTVTTLSQLLVGGTEGADALEAAAKALSGTQRPGNHHVTLQLDPPELGQLRLDIKMQHHEMTLRVAADTADVARLIESRLAELRDALATHGIRIDRSEVVVRPHGTDNTNSQTGQQGSSSNGTDGNGTGTDTSGATWSDEGSSGEAPDQGAWDEPPTGPIISYPEPDVVSEWEEALGGSTQEMLVDLVA
ncbi:MAG TPA: flagellar hook-length control protein FliK [Phycisphaerae bacterium]|nr:flagellar hook-length control protein FliK [Phycisphaerae bacterium]